MPRALLLDFGSVVSVSVFERHSDTERLLGLRPGELTWLGPVDPSTDPLWRDMQREQITEREYWATRARELGERIGESGWDMNTMLRRIRQAVPESVVRPQMRTLLNACHDHCIPCGILSNELELFYGRDFLEQMRILDAFTVIVDASTTQILKPDPRAYELAVTALDARADEILFVDDQFRNVAGAFRVGLQTQHFDLRDINGSMNAIAARLRLPVEYSL